LHALGTTASRRPSYRPFFGNIRDHVAAEGDRGRAANDLGEPLSAELVDGPKVLRVGLIERLIDIDATCP
jgi:hypothetical protein